VSEEKRGTSRGKVPAFAPREIVSACLTTAAFVLLIIAIACSVVEWNGTNGDAYRDMQIENGVKEAEIGISYETLRRLNMALGDYLAGDKDALNVEAEVWGKMQPAFNERELMHMEDVYALFALARSVKRWTGWLALGLLIAATWVRGRNAWKERLRRLSPCYRIALLLILLPLGAFAVWAAVDFSAAFTFFHEILFTNDLWLLDYDTDLMIRMLPQGFFEDIALRIVVQLVIFLVLIDLALWFVRRAIKEK